MKLLIIGHGRHGKDSVADIINELWATQGISSSMFAAERVVFRALRDEYPDAQACYEDRANRRTLWFELIRMYSEHDPARLARELLQEYDIYVGMRCRAEFDACMAQGLFDYVIWVDATARGIPQEPSSSMELTPEDATYCVYNDGDLQKLYSSTVELLQALMHDNLRRLT